MIFYYLDNLGILNTRILLSNLILLVICRGFYVVTYVLNYTELFQLNSKIENQKEFIIKFILTQIIIVFIGILLVPLTIGFSFYSLQIGGSFIQQIGDERKSTNLLQTGNLVKIILPLLGLCWYGLAPDAVNVATIGFTLIIFHYYGEKRSQFSSSKQFETEISLLKRAPRALFISLAIIILVIPSLIVIGTVIYANPPIQTYKIEMQDGVNLATDVYLARGSFGSPRPVILIRTPYGKAGMGAAIGILHLLQGYHVVVQDIRGTFDSEDHEKFLMFQSDYLDGLDTIDWILEQKWCNGKIASVGASALTINSYFYAGMNPDGLVAQTLMIGTPDLYKTSMWQGGTLKESIVTGWLEGTADNYEYQLEQMISHPKKDIYYNTTSLFIQEGPSFQKINIPALHIGGWYDPFQQGTLDGFMGYNVLGQTGAQGKQLLIMGPFTHGIPGEGKHGELVFPARSISAFDLYLDWEQKLFDHAFYGKPIDWSRNRVAYYMMGDINDTSEGINDYRYANTWPVPYKNNTWFLTESRQLVKNLPGTDSVNISYLYDPRDPVPTLGGTNLILPAGPYDQRPIENRGDVLIFETPPLSENIEVVGQMWAKLWVMSNCTNTDFTVKITDVYPDGKSMLISDGIINALRRDGMDIDAPPLNSAGPVEVRIDLWSTAYRFNEGHKIRVAISSSNYPRFAINPNTGAPQEIYSYQYLERFIANNTLLIGLDDYQSCIILPTPI